jgi:hypothetical protein
LLSASLLERELADKDEEKGRRRSGAKGGQRGAARVLMGSEDKGKRVHALGVGAPVT